MEETKTDVPRVIRGKVELRVPFEKGELSFIHPAHGPGTYVDVGDKISKAGLRKPTMAETASLVHAAWQNQDNTYSKEIIDKLRTRWLWGFNGILYVPKEGAYIKDNPGLVDGKVRMNKDELTTKLEANDQSVRFVPFGFKIEEQTSGELAKNPFVIGLAGEEGAEKFAQIADKYKQKPWVFSFRDVDEEITRVASLISGYYVSRLIVYGSSFGDNCDGLSFGVMETAEGGSPENGERK